jgi:ribosome-binding ATPase YchF (GTP1/OBG family)
METIGDIVREMRKRFEPYAKSDSTDARYVAYLGYAEFADRIEAATKTLEADRDNWRDQAFAEASRANAATCKEYLQVGNAAKMREAVEKVVEIAKREWNAFRETSAMYEMHEICTAALAAPPRNCDVGTAEEQEERYIKLKREHVDRLLRCPAEGSSFFPDSLYWAQMPYESEVKNVANS